MPEEESIANQDLDSDRQKRGPLDRAIIGVGVEPIELSREGQEKFAELILNPGPLAPALRRAMERRKSFLIGLS